MTAVPPTSEADAVVKYRPFVVQQATQYVSSDVSKDDLIQEGLLAVALAYRSWRSDGGANFLTWIRRPVQFAMLRLIREQKRGGGSFRGGARDVEHATEMRFVSLDELSGIGLAIRHLHGIEHPVRDTDTLEGVHSLHEVVGAAEDSAFDRLDLERLPAAMTQLDRRERRVIRFRFEQGLTLAQVGKKMRLSGDAVRRIEQGALRRLRDLMTQGRETTS